MFASAIFLLINKPSQNTPLKMPLKILWVSNLVWTQLGISFGALAFQWGWMFLNGLTHLATHADCWLDLSLLHVSYHHPQLSKTVEQKLPSVWNLWFQCFYYTILLHCISEKTRLVDMEEYSIATLWVAKSYCTGRNYCDQLSKLYVTEQAVTYLNEIFFYFLLKKAK